MPLNLHQSPDPLYKIVNILETSSVASVAEDRQWFGAKSLSDKSGDDSSVVDLHSGTVRVENTRDPSVDAKLTVECHGQRLGVTFSLIVDASRPDGIHVTVIAFHLRMDERVAVHLARARKQERS